MYATYSIGCAAFMADVARVRVPASYLGHRRNPAPITDPGEAET